ncbi:hypothetical protein Spica_2227 [Gracilinema caldarium DSM 7334]|uniref:Helicase XPB/Ssl2 N-terminal domain-containing protein n=1 Tax=Gracilinema caldarium (strain ATCC 51460 / DSM 7334 / H1) TaxID=744872 RepID=F8F273_GRAC1|nr:hypothetical protein Spica_2227 [Gracilinema caldarium DSM 7334]
MGVFWGFVNFETLFKKYEIDEDLHNEIALYEPSQYLIELEPALSLFTVVQNKYLYLYELFRSLFIGYMKKPPEYSFQELMEAPTDVWSNETTIVDNLSLLIQVSKDVLHDERKYSRGLMESGLTKTEIKSIRPLCGQGEFPLSKIHGLDPIELFVRWYQSVQSDFTEQDGTVPQILRKIVPRFFNPEKTFYKLDDPLGSFFEFAVLTEHLSFRQVNSARISAKAPDCRSLFWHVFVECAKAQRWFSVESLYKTLYVRGYRFTYADPYIEKYSLFCRAEYIDIGEEDALLNSDYQRIIYVWGPQSHLLMGLPLFKGYWYLLALLGLVEISEKEPPKPLHYNGKDRIISRFDGLFMVRVTKLGAYCLGLIDEYETQSQTSYEALADKDLLLVTFRGKSLGHKLFLEQIGNPLGPDRYKIDEISFMRACTTYKQVEMRINKFKQLISPEPSVRWNEFFRNLKSRFGVLKSPQRALLYDLTNASPEVYALLQNEKIRPLYSLVEGNKIVVSLQDEQKFLSVAKSLGFFIDGG